jgi:hypothetical protein
MGTNQAAAHLYKTGLVSALWPERPSEADNPK